MLGLYPSCFRAFEISNAESSVKNFRLRLETGGSRPAILHKSSTLAQTGFIKDSGSLNGDKRTP
jgi:hypothetical protein